MNRINEDVAVKGTMEHSTPKKRSTNSYLVFRLGSRRCAIGTSRVREVVHLPHLDTPPGMPSVMEGMMRLGNEVVPVFKLDRLFDLDEVDAHLYSPLIVVNDATGALAFVVDGVDSVTNFADEDLASISDDDTFNGCVIGQRIESGGAISILEVERVLLREEREVVAEFQRRVADRVSRLEDTHA